MKKIRYLRSRLEEAKGGGNASGDANYAESVFPRAFFSENVFLLITFWRYIYIIFQRWKVKKKSQKQ